MKMLGKKMGQNDNSFYSALELNTLTYNYYLNKIIQLAVSSFEWLNMPEEIDTRFIELKLLELGSCCFFEDEIVKKYVCLPSTNTGKFNLYNIPKRRRAYATNGYQKTVTNKNSVLIYENQLHYNQHSDIELFAKRLTNITRAMDVNISAQRTPVMILTKDESQRLSMKNLYMKYDGNEPFIFGDKKLKELNDVTVLNTNAPFVSKDLQEIKEKVWNEVLTHFGIENVSNEKKERMVSDEIALDTGAIVANRESRLKARKQACKEINAMFGLNVDVKFYDSYTSIERSD